MSDPRRSPRPLRILLLIAAGVLVLGACTGQRQIPDKYGDTTRDNFQEGCVEALSVKPDAIDDDDADADGFVAEDLGDTEPFTAEKATNVCRCSYEGISDPDTGIPFEEFKQINDEFEDEPGPLPAELQTIVSGCVESNAG